MADSSNISDKKIADYEIGDMITSFYSIRKKNIREYTKGQFVSLELGDYSGRINGVLWEPDQFALNELEEGMVVKVRGVIGEYNNKKQMTINRLRLAEENEYTIEDILPFSRQTDEERKGRIFALTDKIENSYIKKLVESFWEDEDFLIKFLKAPAGKLWHHSYIGGLSEHSANVTELALRVSHGYDFLDRDMLIFGGLFHDAGKIDTYSTTTNIDYTDEGRLVGHICLADVWICERAKEIENFPEKLLMKLRHMVLSHQGELEYATPVVPQMPEAFVLYYCDEIDSKMGAIERIRERFDGKGWSDYVNLIGRYLYFGENDPTKDEE
ncbi:MAG: HD domain-containing protein [Calditrichaeota bacterium]|nr:MAG: HD domain-containing protein [Calditrichota bacterium]